VIPERSTYTEYDHVVLLEIITAAADCFKQNDSSSYPSFYDALVLSHFVAPN